MSLDNNINYTYDKMNIFALKSPNNFCMFVEWKKRYVYFYGVIINLSLKGVSSAFPLQR